MRASPAHVYLALGGNLGAVQAQFESALRGLARAGPMSAISRLYRTRALLPSAGAAPQPDYLNAVCCLVTRWGPGRLWDLCRALEQAAGRQRQGRWLARPLDLDILFYAPHRRGTAQIRLPHPGLRTRPFVLRPLADLVHHEKVFEGLKTSVGALLAAHDDPEDGIVDVRGWNGV